MVNVITVAPNKNIDLEGIDISLNNFRKAFGRNPTEAEQALMLKLKSKKERQINTSNTGNLMDRSKKSQEIAIARANKIYKDKVKCTPRGIQVNKALNYGLTVEQIMDLLLLTDEQVSATIERFKLPRPVSELFHDQKVRN